MKSFSPPLQLDIITVSENLEPESIQDTPCTRQQSACAGSLSLAQCCLEFKPWIFLRERENKKKKETCGMERLLDQPQHLDLEVLLFASVETRLL